MSERDKTLPAGPGLEEKIEAWARETRALREELLGVARGQTPADKAKATRAAMALEQAAVFVELTVQGQVVRVTLG